MQLRKSIQLRKIKIKKYRVTIILPVENRERDADLVSNPPPPTAQNPVWGIFREQQCLEKKKRKMVRKLKDKLQVSYILDIGSIFKPRCVFKYPLNQNRSRCSELPKPSVGIIRNNVFPAHFVEFRASCQKSFLYDSEVEIGNLFLWRPKIFHKYTNRGIHFLPDWKKKLPGLPDSCNRFLMFLPAVYPFIFKCFYFTTLISLAVTDVTEEG